MDIRNLIKLSHMYYILKMTQQEIADSMGISRVMVSRMLKLAEDKGIVKIHVNYQGGFIELEEKLRKRFKIEEFVIVPSAENQDVKQVIAGGAVGYLEYRLRGCSNIAVGWGSSMRLLADMINFKLEKNVNILPMVGGHGKAALNIHASQIAETVAQKTGCRGYSILAPAIASSEESRDMLMQDPLIREVIKMAHNVDAAVFGIGSPFGTQSTINASGYFTQQDIEVLRNEEVECDIISTLYLDKAGRLCGTDITRRCVGLTKDELKNIPLKIAIAGGVSKKLAIELALKSHYVDVMITDSDVALYLLNATE